MALEVEPWFTVRATSVSSEALTNAGFRLVWRRLDKANRGKPRWYYHANLGPYKELDLAVEERNKVRLRGIKCDIVPVTIT